jgi:uncharacterized protein with ParB-like and HNH nuclease domain
MDISHIQSKEHHRVISSIVQKCKSTFLTNRVTQTGRRQISTQSGLLYHDAKALPVMLEGQNIVNNVLELKTVNQLQEFNFFVPSYQRGYRWTEKEVVELLEDISNFNPRLVGDSDEKTWYCLQPIVLKKTNDGSYEIIDGQQRLTTMYLILYYLNQDFVEAKRDKLFQIHYETRGRSENFLKSLHEIENEEDNIDSHFIASAYRKIGEWFSDKGLDFDIGDFRSKFKFHSKVIWYLSNEEDSIAIFTRINIGKIPLTNSELIKALFLNSSNFSKNEKTRLRQLEISTEWDQIEQSLQNDKFWYFITQKKLSTNCSGQVILATGL